MKLKTRKRENYKPQPKEEKKNPDWATLEENSLPLYMYETPNTAVLEECFMYGLQIPYKQIKVKNLPVLPEPAYLSL